jgi:hypothetical protein
VLGVTSVFVAVSGVVAALYTQASLDRIDGGVAVNGPLDQVLLVVSVALVVLAAVNAILIGWTTALDARLPSAIARALGATPEQTSTGIATAFPAGRRSSTCCRAPGRSRRPAGG